MGKNRWDELADILVNYSTQVQKGDRVLVTMMETDTFPLARAVHASAVRAGATSTLQKKLYRSEARVLCKAKCRWSFMRQSADNRIAECSKGRCQPI